VTDAVTDDMTTEYLLVPGNTEQVCVQFQFPDNYTTHASNESAFIEHVRPLIAAELSIREDRLTDFLVADDGTLARALYTLQSRILLAGPQKKSGCRWNNAK
jgi:hypothetical protein